MRSLYLRATGQTIEINDEIPVRLMDSAPEPLVEISADTDAAGSKLRVPLTIRGSDWLGRGFPDPPSRSKLSAGEILDAMLESDPDEVLLAVSAWLGVHAGRVRG